MPVMCGHSIRVRLPLYPGPGHTHEPNLCCSQWPDGCLLQLLVWRVWRAAANNKNNIEITKKKKKKSTKKKKRDYTPDRTRDPRVQVRARSDPTWAHTSLDPSHAPPQVTSGEPSWCVYLIGHVIHAVHASSDASHCLGFFFMWTQGF